MEESSYIAIALYFYVKISLNFMYMDVIPAYMTVCHMCAVPVGARRGH